MAYPPPPDFYKLYAPPPPPPAAAAAGGGVEAAGSSYVPPPGPPPPVKGEYTVFGSGHSTVTVDAPFEQSKLYRSEGSDVDLREELKRLNGEVLRRFMSLTENLVEAPSQYERRVEEITLLFNNLHHLLNSIRQARATLEHVLREQVRQKREKLEELRERTAAATAATAGAPAHLVQTVDAAVAGAGAGAGAGMTELELGDGMQIDG